VVSFMVPFFNFDLHKTQVEHIDPSVYAAPNLTCPGPPPYDLQGWSGAIRPITHTLSTFYSPIKMPEVPEEEEESYPAPPVAIKKPQQQPPTPVLPQQFITQWAQYVVYADISWPFASGAFAIDNKLGGVMLQYGGETAPDISPMYFEMTVLAAPTEQNITGYLYGRQICWLMGVVASSSWLQVFPLKIPDGATFLGNVTCREKDLCSSWTWSVSDQMYGDAILEVWVSYTIPEVVRFYVNATVVEYGGNTFWDFSNTQIGPVNPSVFAPPSEMCVPLDEPAVETLAKRLNKMTIHH